jgi:serine/threonine-protein kinase
MSPEQVLGLKPLMVHSDLFSLGAVYYYLLTGLPPFMAETMPDLYRQIVEEPHVPVLDVRPGLDRGIARLVDSLLSKDPGRRGQSPAEVVNVLRKFLMRKKVVNPVERIAAYVEQLSADGFQTTSNLSPEQIRLWLGSLDLKRPIPKKQWKRNAVIAATSVAILGVTAWMILRPRGEGALTASATPHTPKPNAFVLKSKMTVLSIPESSEGKQFNRAVLPRTIPSSPSSKAELLSNQAPAMLTVQTLPPFAEVLIDGHSIGHTPLEGQVFPVGKHRLILKSKLGKEIDTNLALISGPQSYRFVFLENPEEPDSEVNP